MEELKDLLYNIKGSYEEFVDFTLSVARKSSGNRTKLIRFIFEREDVSISDVIYFMTVDLGLYEEYKALTQNYNKELVV